MIFRDKYFFKQKILKVLEAEKLQLCIGIIVLIWMLYKKPSKATDILDFTLVTSLVFLYCSKIVSEIFSKKIRSDIEDFLKLETNYEYLIKKYSLSNNLIKYVNKGTSGDNEKLGRKNTICKYKTTDEKDEYTFPVEYNMIVGCSQLEIIDKKDEYYESPEIVKQNFDYLIKAHGESKIYNQVNIRLDKYSINENTLILETSRTTYFDSLVTNRCLDYKLENGINLRELLNSGPWLHSLEESKLSNHIGFNIYIETSDGKFILIKRNNKVAIGKNKIGSSVGASLKTKYALDDNREFTKDKFKNSILSEIKDELRIKKDEVEFSFEDNLIAIYRDMIEGGKPQFLFYIKSKISSNELELRFKEEVKNNKANKRKTIFKEMDFDGEKLIFIDRADLHKIYLTPDLMIYNDNVYESLPSVTGTLAIVINECIK